MTATTITPNLHKVPVKQWRKWSEAARATFNHHYSFVLANPAIMNHPKAAKLQPEHWKTIAWNSAWLAACYMDDEIINTVVDIDRKTGATVKVRKVKKAA